MRGSDYPHPDGIWPDPHKCFGEDIGLMTPVRCKYLCDNAGKLHGLL